MKSRLSRLFHFSEDEHIEVFTPRPPVRHPEAEAYVWAITESMSPLYLFPRDCPRIGTHSGSRVTRLLIDERYETQWRIGRLFRYEFDPNDGFVDCDDHGVHVSKASVRPIERETISDMPAAIAAFGIEVEIVPNLAEAARGFFDFEREVFTYPEDVSMIRMGLLPDWPGSPGLPAVPQATDGA